jgi:hypothetical protein
MKVLPFSDNDLDIARTRIVLSLLAMLSLYIDPTTPGLGRSGNQNKWRVRRQQPAGRTHPPDNA